MIIDSHCHLHDEKFSDDLDEVLARAKDAGISHMITIGCDIETTKKAALLAQRFPNIFFSAGFHPHEAKFLDPRALAELESLAKEKKCVAIGEIGLDYYYQHSSKDEQRQALLQQLLLARRLDLPVVIHLRDAFDDCIAILRRFEDLLEKTVIHCFSGTLEEAKIFTKMGCSISLSGIVTFKNPKDLLRVAESTDIKKLLVETDCPYLAPHPLRGKRNEPALIVHTLKAITSARKEDVHVIEKQIHQNTMEFFRLPKGSDDANLS